MLVSVLVTLLSALVVAFMFYVSKAQKSKSTTKVKLDHYRKVVTDTEKAYKNNLRHVLTPNLEYFLNLVIEDALKNVVNNSIYCPIYSHRLLQLTKKNSCFTLLSGSAKLHDKITIKLNDPIFNMGLVAHINKLRRMMQCEAIRKKVPKNILLAEIISLDVLQTRITVENIIAKVKKSIDMAKYGMAREHVNNIKSAISNANLQSDYRLIKTEQVSVFEDVINKALYKPSKPKTLSEIQKDKEWDQVFKRNRRSINYHL